MGAVTPTTGVRTNSDDRNPSGREPSAGAATMNDVDGMGGPTMVVIEMVICRRSSTVVVSLDRITT